MAKVDPKRLLEARDSLSTLLSRIKDENWVIVGYDHDWNYEHIGNGEPEGILAQLEYIKDLLGQMITTGPSEPKEIEPGITRSFVHHETEQ